MVPSTISDAVQELIPLLPNSQWQKVQGQTAESLQMIYKRGYIFVLRCFSMI